MDYWTNLDLKDIEGEEWRSIDGYVDFFMVSSFGRVKSLSRTRKAQRGTIAVVTEKILTQKINERGYLNIGLRKDSERKWYGVHRLVTIAFHGGFQKGMTVSHKDFDKTNNFYLNLEWLTQKQNNQHAIAAGRNTVGINNGRSKLTDSDVLSLRIDRSIGRKTYRQLCEKYGVSKAVVWKTVNKKSWKHLQ